MTQQLLFQDVHDGLSFEDVATQLEVSCASVRNWVKTGYLDQISQGVVSIQSFNNFKKKVAGGEKLTSRANKSLKDSHNHEELQNKFISLVQEAENNSGELSNKYEEQLHIKDVNVHVLEKYEFKGRELGKFIKDAAGRS